MVHACKSPLTGAFDESLVTNLQRRSLTSRALHVR